MPKEFAMYNDNHALQFITKHVKLNQRHVKWVEFLQNVTFVIQHTSGKSNKVVNALTIRSLVLQEFQVSVLGFDNLKEMYEEDEYFKEAYASCDNHVSRVSLKVFCPESLRR